MEMEGDYSIYSNEDYFKFKLNGEDSVNSYKISDKIILTKNSKELVNELGTPEELECFDNFKVHNKDKNELIEEVNFYKRGKWTKEEDNILMDVVPRYGNKNWKKVAECVRGRTPIQCLHRWTKILQPGIVKGTWTIEEDRKLIQWIKKEGPTRWSQCAEFIKGRSGKQCRERWFNSLNPNVKKGNWTPEEDFIIFFCFRQFGAKWSKIAFYFEGRTENSIKNRFYSTLRSISSEGKKSSSFPKLQNDTISKTNESSNGRNNLLNYFDLAETISKCKFMKHKNFNEEELDQYEKILFQNIKSNKTKKKIRGETIDKIDLTNSNNENKLIKNRNKTKNNFIENPDISSITFGDNHSYNSDRNANPLMNYESFKNKEINFLEKEISSMCDNTAFYQENQLLSLYNQIDNLIDKMFINNNIVITNDMKQECYLCQEISEIATDDKLNLCLSRTNTNNEAINFDVGNKYFKTPINKNICSSDSGNKESIWKLKSETTKNKEEVFQNLLSQLNGLEKLVKSTKKELIKYEKSEL